MYLLNFHETVRVKFPRYTCSSNPWFSLTGGETLGVSPCQVRCLSAD